MSDKFWEKLRSKKPEPEESIPFRVFTLLTVLTGVLAVLSRDEWPEMTIPVIIITFVGYYISYVRRTERNILLKIVISFLMIYALLDFFRNLRQNPLDPRIPLAHLLVWLQTLHSFDLPSRRDLVYSLMVGLILITVASVITVDSNIIFYYILFLMAGTAAMAHNTLSKFNSRADKKAGFDLKILPANIALVLLLVTVITMVTFLFVPRYESSSFVFLPRSWVINLPRLTRGSLFNTGHDDADSLRGQPSSRLTWNPDNYFGFNSYVHLNYRGRLSDDEVMKVQSSRWVYFRGLAFDKYDGTGWEITGEEEEDFETVSRAFPPIRFDPEDYMLYNWNKSHEIVQIYHIRREMPNIIFGAYFIHLLYFPSETVYRDKNGGLRSPYPLEKGMVYSTISRYNPLTREDMDRIEKNHQRRKFLSENREWEDRYIIVPDDYQRYLQLPGDIPPRVESFTRMILNKTVGADASDLRKSLAIAEYLKGNYEYDLDVPHFPDKWDTADYFLLEEKRGYCEHFATAMTVMLRTQGIPARLIFGYLPGQYNPVSRFYTVRQSDAHAWVEVFIPDYGWHAIDPTPGFNQDIYSENRNRESMLIMKFINRIREFIDRGVFPQYAFWLLPLLLGLLFMVRILHWIYKKELAKTGNRKITFYRWLAGSIGRISGSIRNRYAGYRGAVAEHRGIAVYRGMLSELEKAGINKKESMTAREFLNNSIPDSLLREAESIVNMFEAVRYGHREPLDEQMAGLEKNWEKLKEEIKDYKNRRNNK